MGFDRDSVSVLILLSLPMQYNLCSDSMNKIMNGMVTTWKHKTELTENERYFADKMTGYFGVVFSILFAFLYYRVGKMRIVISLLFICDAITWLLYFAVDEDKVYVLYIIKALQGIYTSGLQVAHFSYIMHFAHDRMKCFYGCMTQFSMFTGLFLENLLFSFVDYKAGIIIFFAECSIFGGLIWFVPEYYVKQKSFTKESIFHKENLRSAIISTIAMCLQLLSAIGVMLNSLSQMLEGVGIKIKSSLQSCLFDFVGGLSGLISAFITDAIGTKYMFCFSSFGLFIGLMMYAIAEKVTTPNWFGALGVFVYFLFYGLGMGPIPWYLFSTMFPEGCRIESSALGTLVNLFVPTPLDSLWDYLDKTSGKFGSVIFGACDCIVAIVFGLFFLPIEHYNDEETINIL